MHDQSDAQLLRAYAEHGTETAFAEIVARHTDLVYSAALRQVYSPDLARDVTQSVFTDLARKAREVSFKLTPEASLVGWLYRGTRFAARDLNRTEIRRTQRERQAMEQVHPTPETPPDWEQLRPALDDAMSELDETDRDALLLRYFKNHDLRTVGATLGISDDAAQKRVSRAMERLRELFAKRGVTVGASGLAVVISANAVQAAPAGLALTISNAAVLTGTTLATTTTITATKAIAMTALQKTLVTATIAVLAGAGIYEARQASQLREQVETFQQQQAPLAQQVAQLNQAFIDATNHLAALRDDNERLNQNTIELLKLRNEVRLLRQQTNNMGDLHSENRRLQSILPANGINLKESNLAFRGYATPIAALESAIFSLFNSNRTTFLASLTTVERERAEKLMADRIQNGNKSEAEIVADDGITAKKTREVRIIDQQTNSDDRATLRVQFLQRTNPDGGKYLEKELNFQRIGDEWKLDDGL